MRQAGVLAAAGLIALEKMPARLHEDHANAKLLASALARMRGIQIDPERVQTNIVVFDIAETGMDTKAFSAQLQKNGVLANGISPTKMRMVTHMDVTARMCEEAVNVLKKISTDAVAQAKTSSI
jgi:threonine aldolase